MTSAPVPDSQNVMGHVPLRLAMVGGGRVTEACHLPALVGMKDRIQVVALAEVDEHRRRRVAGMFDIPQTFTDVHSMLGSGVGIDVVAVCTPAKIHVESALAAIEAGKHLFIEKPIALTLDDADRIVEAIARKGVKAGMGFNLRHHRNVRRAREMIAAGVLGEIHLIRSVWTSGIHTRMQLPNWRGRRTSGGGAISEIAVHHIDLARYLTGQQIKQVFAQSQHGESDDEVVGLILRLGDGATVSSAFTERSGDSNEMELIGSKGRLSFSLYQFDTLNFTRIGEYGGRGKRIKQMIREFPEALSILRRGGVFHESYRNEWEAFAKAIHDTQSAMATVEDGREALRVVLAAGASANRGVPVGVDDAPREPAAVPNRAPMPAAPSEPSPAEAPRLSAIIATRGVFDSIRRTVKHLHAQTIRDQIELVIVCPSRAELKLDESAVEGFWGYEVVELGPFNSIAPANAAGSRAARARIVAFCEDHSFPDPDWARSLCIAHQGPYAVVGPAVHNANPGALVSRADFLIGYGAWAEPIKPCEPHHLPGHNSSYKKDILLAYGDRLVDMLDAESVLHWELCRAGHRLYLDPTARLAHTNFALLPVWTKVQYHAGRIFGGTRSIGWPLWKRLFYTAASPLIPFVRLRRIWCDARRLPGQFKSLPLFMMVLYGLLLDAVGQAVGYTLGTGASNQIAHEFCRVHHITDEDRRQLEIADRASSSS